MKLELKHLSGYLPYSLKIARVNYDGSYKGIEYLLKGIYINVVTQYDNLKPVMRPFSDLTKEIEVNGEKFVATEKIAIHLFDNNTRNYILDGHTNAIPYWVIQKLLEWHFDLFSLIENNLAIDINTLNKDVY